MMINRTFARPDDGGLLPRLFWSVLGTRMSVVSDSGSRHRFFFWVGCTDTHGIQVVLISSYFLYYISSLCSGGFCVCVCRHALVRTSPVCVRGTSLMCRGRECVRLGSGTRHVCFYVSLVGGGLRPTGSVRIYRSVIRTLYT
jgi:hypothetical protein